MGNENNVLRHANNVEEMMNQLYESGAIDEDIEWKYINIPQNVKEGLFEAYNNHPSMDISIEGDGPYVVKLHEKNYAQDDCIVLNFGPNSANISCSYGDYKYLDNAALLNFTAVVNNYEEGTVLAEYFRPDSVYLGAEYELTQKYRKWVSENLSINPDSIAVTIDGDCNIYLESNGLRIKQINVGVPDDDEKKELAFEQLINDSTLPKKLKKLENITIMDQKNLVHWISDKYGLDYSDIKITFNDDGTVSVGSSYVSVIAKSDTPITSKKEFYDFLTSSPENLDKIQWGSRVTTNNLKIVNELKSKIYSEYGIIPGLNVSCVGKDGNYIVYVSAQCLPNPIAIPIEYGSSLDDVINNVDNILKQALDGFTANINGTEGYNNLFHLQAYLNEKIRGGYADIGYKTEGGIIYITTGSYEMPVTLEELMNYEKSPTIQSLIDMENAKNDIRYDQDGNPKNVAQDIDIIPKLDKNGNIEGYYYYANGQKVFSSSIEEAKQGIIDALTGDEAGYHTLNPLLSRKRNKSIADFDEIQYGGIISNLKSIGQLNLSTAKSAGDTLDQYCKREKASEILSGIESTVDELDQDVNLLCQMIDSVVYMYINCDYYMRQVLDGIFSGGVTEEGDYVKAKGSFVDYIFSLRNDSDRKKLAESRGAFTSKYIQVFTDYVDEVSDLAKNHKHITSGEKIYLGKLTQEEKEFYAQNGIDIDKDGCVDLETFTAKFADRILLSKNGELDESNMEIDAKFIDETYNYVLKPLQRDLMFVNAYESFPETVSAINDLEVYRDNPEFIGAMLSDEYKKNLENIRKNGASPLDAVLAGVLDYDFSNLLLGALIPGVGMEFKGLDVDQCAYLTPSELALFATLNPIHKNTFIDKFDYRTTKRKGEVLAAKELYNICKHVSELDDYGDALVVMTDLLRQSLEGAYAGLDSTNLDLYHLLDHDNTSDQWKKYYMSKFLADTPTIYELKQMYQNGDISGEVYMAYVKMMDDTNKAFAQAGRTVYDVSETISKAAKEVAEDIVLSYATAGYGVAMKAAAKAVLKGLTTAGHVFNEQSAEQIYRMFDFDFYANGIGQGVVKGLLTFVTESCKNYIKYGDEWSNFSRIQKPENVEEELVDKFVDAQKNAVARGLSWEAGNVTDEFLENVYPGMKLWNTIMDYSMGGDKFGQLGEHLGVLFLSYVAKGSEDTLCSLVDYWSDPENKEFPDLNDVLTQFIDESVGYGAVDEILAFYDTASSGGDVTSDSLSLLKEVIIKPLKKGAKANPK